MNSAHNRQEREAVRIAATVEYLQANPEALSDKPHPTDYRAIEGETMRDWSDWIMVNSGNASRMKVARFVGC